MPRKLLDLRPAQALADIVTDWLFRYDIPPARVLIALEELRQRAEEADEVSPEDGD